MVEAMHRFPLQAQKRLQQWRLREMQAPKAHILSKFDLEGIAGAVSEDRYRQRRALVRGG